MMVIVNKIVHVIYAIALTLPLLMSLLYLLKIIRDSKRKDKAGKFALKLITVSVFFVIAVFLIFIIAITFVIRDIKIPSWLNLLGSIVFILYYATFGGFLYGLGELGQGGVSPNKVIRELYNDFFKKKRETEGTRIE